MIASALTPVAQQQGSSFPFLISLVLMVAIFYLLLIRPQQRRQRQQRQMMHSLDVGDEVITIGGIFGRIKSMDDQTVTLDVGAGDVRFAKQAIARKLEPSTGEEASEGS